MIPLDLAGQVALVTGSGAGIGREIARWLARAGAAVAVHDVRGDRAEETAAAIGVEGGRAAAIVADARDDAAIDLVLMQTIERLGGLDVLVNNVGMMAGRHPAPATELDGAYWRDVIDQNLIVTALFSAGAGRAMVAAGRGGVIVNVSSGETTRPAPGLAAYAAAKAGINHLTQTLAVELGPHGIRVVAVAPGTTLTESVRAAFDEERVAAIVASNPLRRMSEPDDLARLVVFLASDLARCITGQLILADAGAHLSRSRPAPPART